MKNKAKTRKRIHLRISQYQPHLVGASIIHERYGPGGDRRAIQLRLGDPAVAALRV